MAINRFKKRNIIIGTTLFLLVCILALFAWPKENMDSTSKMMIRRVMPGDITVEPEWTTYGIFNECKYWTGSTVDYSSEQADIYYTTLERTLKSSGWKIDGSTKQDGIKQSPISLDRGYFSKDLNGSISLSDNTVVTTISTCE